MRGSKNKKVGVSEKIEEINVSEEMQGSFLEYAYSVIYSRALPDARDGLKPVQRRILFQMDELGLRPDRGHVKSSRVVGEVMGKLHPHGDTAIYDALVRLAQPFNQRVPLVDGHGNFGSLDDGPAAPRYTEARLAAPALFLTSQLHEDTVDFVPNYDNQFQQPEVLPAAFPSLLTNGASGIAVGMATNIAPHNPGEALEAALHLLENPEATTEDLMRFIPGPDFPGGGIIHDLDPIREAYETGRGSFKVRAKVAIERVSPRKMGLVVTELPYMVGPERIIERIKDAVTKRRLSGISAVTNLTDRHHGLRLVIDIRPTFNPEAVLAELYRLTPLEEAFSMNAVALVEGQPRLLPLKEMLRVFVDHRLDVTRRRTAFRLDKQTARLHLVEGLLRAIVDIDEVISIVRSSDDAAAAKERLITAFDLSEVQAEYILELRLRRLTRFSRIELETEQEELRGDIAHLEQILASRAALVETVAGELRETAVALASPRRTVLQDGDAGAAVTAATGTGGKRGAQLEIEDEPCIVLLTADGGLVRVAGTELPPLEPQADSSLWRQATATRTRAQIGLVTDDGQAHRVDVVSLPPLVRSPGGMSLTMAVPALELVESRGAPVGLFPLDEAPVLGLATRQGVVKRVRPDHPESKDSWPIITLDAGDRVVNVAEAGDEADLVFVTREAQLLRTKAANVRPQGIAAGGMAGIKLSAGDEVIEFAAVDPAGQGVAVTVAGPFGASERGPFTSVKTTPLEEFPVKGRGTMGVRCHRFLSGEGSLGLAWVGDRTPRAAGSTGTPVPLPAPDPRRDASGTPVPPHLYLLG